MKHSYGKGGAPICAHYYVLKIGGSSTESWQNKWSCEADLVGRKVHAEDHELDGDDGLQHDDNAIDEDGAPLILQPSQPVRSICAAQRIQDDKRQACVQSMWRFVADSLAYPIPSLALSFLAATHGDQPSKKVIYSKLTALFSISFSPQNHNLWSCKIRCIFNPAPCRSSKGQVKVKAM